MKTGDFSSLLGAPITVNDPLGNPVTYQKGAIFDPVTTVYATAANATSSVPVGTPISRQMFPGNIRFRRAVSTRHSAKILSFVSRHQSAYHHRQWPDPRFLLRLAGRPEYRSG